MPVELLIRLLQEQSCYFAVPKDYESRDSVEQTFGPPIGEQAESWLLCCRHVFSPPAAPEHLLRTEQRLGFPMPGALRQLLLLCDGASLFALRHQYLPEDNAWIPRYRILSAAQLADCYWEMLRSFRTDPDPEYQGVTELNYLPFCDVGNRDFLALVRLGSESGRIIYVDHDFALSYHPYDDWTREAYATVSTSLEEWLTRLIETQGWGGLGPDMPPI